MTKAGLMRSASRLARFGRREDGAVAIWFSILLVPMLGMTFAAIKYSEYAGHRTGMIDAMDAAGLGLARQFEFDDLEACELADGAEGVDDPEEVSGKERARLERYARGFFEENYPEYDQLYGDKELSEPFDLDEDMSFTLTCAYIRVEADAYADMGGVLGGYFGVGALPVNLETEISLPGAGRVEIALVLDVTGSMCFPDKVGNYEGTDDCDEDGNSRLDKLRDAVAEMLDDRNFYGPKADGSNEFVRIGVVPFAATVNVGANYNGQAFDGSDSDRVSDWMDGWGYATPASHWHGGNFFNAVQAGTIKGSTPDGPEVDTPNSTVNNAKVNHFTLFNSVGSNGAAWKGCVEARPFPLDESIAVPGDRVPDGEYESLFEVPAGVKTAVDNANNNDMMHQAWDDFGTLRDPITYTGTKLPAAYDGQESGNTEFVPFFSPDQPDCNGNACDWVWGDGEIEKVGKNHPVRAFLKKGSNWENNLEDNQNFPGFFFDDVEVPTSGNDTFVFDAYVTSPKYASDDDLNRYKNVVLAARGAKDCHNSAYSNADNATLLKVTQKFGFDNCLSDEYRLRQAYVGALNADTTSPKYVGKYEHAGDYKTGPNAPGSFAVPGSGPNSGCPGPILPLTTKKAQITAQMDALVAAGGTNTATGLAWGWRLVDHRAPFVQAADPSDPGAGRWKKYVVLMTDGDNTTTYTDRSDVGSYNRSYFGPYGFAAENRLGVDESDGLDPAAAMETELSLKTVRMCHRMRERGIKVYTIGFAIKKNSTAEKMLEACAVDKDSYFAATDGTKLASAFEKITEQIVELHVSG